jgi:hypothetical protein
MIIFSWNKINNKFDWNANSVLEYFYLKRDLDVPSFLNRKISHKVLDEICKPYPEGACFIIHPDEVLKAAKDPHNLYSYIELASKRNIFDYNIRGIRHLPTVLAEDYQINWVEYNPLLEIKDNNIYFKYEQEKQHEY